MLDEVSGKLDVFALVAVSEEGASACDSEIVELCFFWFLNACLKVFVFEEVMFVELRIGLYDVHIVVDLVHCRAEKKRFERIGAAFCRAHTKAVGDCIIDFPYSEDAGSQQGVSVWRIR